jgi:hypothetical protein
VVHVARHEIDHDRSCASDTVTLSIDAIARADGEKNISTLE